MDNGIKNTMHNTSYSSLLLTFLSESPRKFAIFGARRKILAHKTATFHTQNRCIALKRSLAKPLPFIAERTLKGEN